MKSALSVEMALLLLALPVHLLATLKPTTVYVLSLTIECPDPCLTCGSASQCESCLPGFFSYESSCLGKPPLSFRMRLRLRHLRRQLCY